MIVYGNVPRSGGERGYGVSAAPFPFAGQKYNASGVALSYTGYKGKLPLLANGIEDMSLINFLITFIALLSIASMLVVAFFERKNPASSIAWLLVLMFLPVIGFVLYLFLGSGFRISKRKKFEMKAIRDNVYDNFIVKHLEIRRRPAHFGRHGHYGKVLDYLQNCDGIYTDNNSAEIFVSGERMFSRLLGDLRNAGHHIHLLFYIFRDDELGREIVSILTRRAREGLKVRLLYDSVGSMLSFDPMFKGLKKAGGEVAAFSPIFSTLSSHLRLNYRNHRKIAVIDGKVGYVGGMNVGVEYMGRDKKLSPWRDTHMRLTGSSVWFLQERFLMDWGYSAATEPAIMDPAAYFPKPLAGGELGVQIVSSGPDTFESPIKSGLMSMAYSARKNIFIQTPFFAPDQSFFDALRIAARANVDIRLMLPLVASHRIVQYTTLGYARQALELGIKVYLYKGFIHAKTMVIDGKITSIGTCNLTNRSFTLDFEVNAFVYDENLARGYEEDFIRDQANCIPLSPDFFAKQTVFTRACYNCSRLLAPLM